MASDGTKTGNCLHGDGTTKFHRHYQSFLFTASSGRQYTFGLQEIVGSDTAELMPTFTELTEAVAEHADQDRGSKEARYQKLITTIKNTMSDQCLFASYFRHTYNRLKRH